MRSTRRHGSCSMKVNWSDFMNKNLKCAVLLAGLALTARADETMNANPAPAGFTNSYTARVTPLTPQQFVYDANAGNLKEVYLSELALDRCTNNAVRHFAEHMIRDHRAANAKLEQIARTEGLTCLSSNMFRPEDPAWNDPALNPNPEPKGEQARTLIATNVPFAPDYQAVELIKPLSGAQFQDAYVTDMNEDHVAAVSEFEIAVQTLNDVKLENYAEKTLPTLRKHLEMAQHLRSVEFESATTNILSQSQPPYTYPGAP